MHIKLSFITILVLLSAAAYAQVSQVRFEIPMAHNQSSGYNTISLSDNGLVLYALANGREKNAIELIRLDTAFKEIWKGYIPVERNIYIASSQEFDGKIHLLLKDRFNPLAEFLILSIAEKEGNYTVRSVKTLLAMNPTHFIITKEAALIGGYFSNRPLVLYFGFANNQSRILPGFFNEPGELNQVRANNDGSIDIVVSGKSPHRRRSLWVRNYDKMGTLLKTTWLEPDEDKILTFGRTVSQSGGNQIVAGVYGRFTEYSRGIFMANIDPEGNYTIKYYNYADLEHFFNYMKAKREKRIKERIERRKVRGKKTKFNYRLMVNELIANGDQVVMLGEAFYPHYSYPNSMSAFGARSIYSSVPRYYSYGPNSAAYSRGDLVFDGYQYTHAVVIGFDKNGNLKWDNSFEINDVRTMDLQQFVKIHPEKDRVSLVYLFDNVIRSKVIKGNEVLEGKSYDQLHTGFADDLVRERDTRDTKLEHWYGDTFYGSGIQNIRKRRDDGQTIARRVFFINKIAYK
jgi:hypothetical protein